MQDLVRLKTTEIKTLREKLANEQGNVCPLCGKPLTEPCLDHQHKRRKTDEPGVDGAGLVRGVLCRDCNALEGRIWNAMDRHLQPETVKDRVQFLKNLIFYYNKEPQKILYPGGCQLGGLRNLGQLLPLPHPALRAKHRESGCGSR